MTTANFATNQRRRLSLAACKNYAAKAILSTHIRKHLAISITIGLLFGTIGTASAALSATTAQTIQGTAPYIQFNGNPLTSTAELLSIQIGTDTYTADSSGNMYKNGSTTAFTDPISTVTTFDEVVAFITADGAPRSLSSAISTADQIDIDGDIPIVSGDITATWKDKFGTTIDTLTNPLDVCYSDYTLELKTTGSPSIKTQYGDPNETTYDDVTALFKFTIIPPNIVPCWAKPDMSYATGQYAGPKSMWDPLRGFIPQSYSAHNTVNFPTTGSDALFFDLTFANASSYPTWDTTLSSASGISYSLSQVSSDTVRVKLNGPSLATTVKIPTAPTAYFLVKGKDSANKVLEYGFTIGHWYVSTTASSAKGILPTDTAAFCTSIASLYRVPLVKELSNATGTALNKGGPIPYPGPLASAGNYYQRAVGGGFFAEWGQTNMMNYPGSNIQYGTFYSSQVAFPLIGSYFAVSNPQGSVSSLPKNHVTVLPLCTYP